MTLAIVLIVALTLSVVARVLLGHRFGYRTTRSATPLGGRPYDRDVERQLAELRGLRGYRQDPPLFG